MTSFIAMITLLAVGAFAGQKQEVQHFNRSGVDEGVSQPGGPVVDKEEQKEEQEQQLADDVREQADVVSDTTDDLNEKKEYAEGLPTTEELEDDVETTKDAKDKADDQSEKYLTGIALLKYRRDAYKNATEEAEKALAKLEPKLNQTKSEYELLLAGFPTTENASEDAEDDAASAAARLAAANAAGVVAGSNTEYRRFALQWEIARLNDINAELKAVQAKLYGAGSRAGATLYLLALFCGSILAPLLN